VSCGSFVISSSVRLVHFQEVRVTPSSVGSDLEPDLKGRTLDVIVCIVNLKHGGLMPNEHTFILHTAKIKYILNKS